MSATSAPDPHIALQQTFTVSKLKCNYIWSTDISNLLQLIVQTSSNSLGTAIWQEKFNRLLHKLVFTLNFPPLPQFIPLISVLWWVLSVFFCEIPKSGLHVPLTGQLLSPQHSLSIKGIWKFNSHVPFHSLSLRRHITGEQMHWPAWESTRRL